MLNPRRASVLSLVLAGTVSLAAAPVVIRLSTVAPAGTTWDTALKIWAPRGARRPRRE